MFNCPITIYFRCFPNLHIAKRISVTGCERDIVNIHARVYLYRDEKKARSTWRQHKCVCAQTYIWLILLGKENIYVNRVVWIWLPHIFFLHKRKCKNIKHLSYHIVLAAKIVYAMRHVSRMSYMYICIYTISSQCLVSSNTRSSLKG